jgi:Citrate transporter
VNDIAITLSIIGLALVLFAWNPVPAVVVAIGASLALYSTGVLTMPEALTGFGDPVVVLIAALLAIAVAVETTGVGAWAGQLLLRLSGANETMLLVALMVVAAIFSGLIGMNGAVAALLPVTVIIAVRTGIAPSQLMIPLALACLQGGKLTMLGSPVEKNAFCGVEKSSERKSENSDAMRTLLRRTRETPVGAGVGRGGPPLSLSTYALTVGRRKIRPAWRLDRSLPAPACRY